MIPLDLATILTFIGTSILLALVPGPDILFVVTQGMTNGKRAGFTTALGLACGNMVHTLGAWLGIAALFQTSQLLFIVFKLLGAGYLFFLAYKSLRTAGQTIDIGSAVQVKGKSLFARGFIMNTVNPKVALFFLAYFPQFTNPKRGSVGLQILMLGCLFILVVILVFGLVGVFAGQIGEWLMQKPGFSKWLNIGSGVVLAGIGLSILVYGI